ncbi:hypothetical protein EI94DRAFT_197351 [Lactarius quietus]|nr:hypothetical protein EI94DRAFT_197351 [Lactarius quietus]
MGDQAHQFSTPTRLTYRYIHLKGISISLSIFRSRLYNLIEIFVDFIKKRPTAALELVFKDHAGIQHKSDKFKQCDLVHWNMDMSVHSQRHHSLRLIEFRTGMLGPTPLLH